MAEHEQSEITGDEEWQEIAVLCAEFVRDLPHIVPRIVNRIRAEVAGYEEFPWGEQEQYVRVGAASILAGLAARRPPNPEDTRSARAFSRRRAQQGIPMETLINAYHVGYREVWTELLARAEAADPKQGKHLLRLVALMWTWVQVATSAVADEYAQTVSERQAIQVSLFHRFLEALYNGQAAAEETALLARALAFDANGDFQVVCAAATPWSDERLEALQRQLRTHADTLHAAARGSVLVILFQRPRSAAILDLLHEPDSSLPVGVGLVRPGLLGAAASIVDAERALALATRQGGLVRFDASWLVSTLLQHRERLTPLLGTDVAANHPHLSDAVLAYAQHGFSVTASAAALQVHPNTVKYRLDRWRQQTGWDPRTLDGLLKSIASISLYP
jgi:hypothetical protein